LTDDPSPTVLWSCTEPPFRLRCSPARTRMTVWFFWGFVALAHGRPGSTWLERLSRQKRLRAGEGIWRHRCRGRGLGVLRRARASRRHPGVLSRVKFAVLRIHGGALARDRAALDRRVVAHERRTPGPRSRRLDLAAIRQNRITKLAASSSAYFFLSPQRSSFPAGSEPSCS